MKRISSILLSMFIFVNIYSMEKPFIINNIKENKNQILGIDANFDYIFKYAPNKYGGDTITGTFIGDGSRLSGLIATSTNTVDTFCRISTGNIVILLNAEIVNRVNGDFTLTTNLNNEITNRTNADISEASIRTSSDTYISNYIIGLGTTGAFGDNFGNHKATMTIDMQNNIISNISSITVYSDSLYTNASVFNLGEGIYDNYLYGIGIGYTSRANNQYGIGVGYNAQNNNQSGIGIGYNSYNNLIYGIGIGYETNGNTKFGIGIGAYSKNNHGDYGVDGGVGVGEDTYNNYYGGVGVGSYSKNNFNYGVGIRSSENHDFGVGIGYNSNYNYTYGLGIGYNSLYNHDYGIGIGYLCTYNYNYGIGIGHNCTYNNDYAIALGNNINNNSQRSINIGNNLNNNYSSSTAIGHNITNTAFHTITFGENVVNNSTYTFKIDPKFTVNLSTIQFQDGTILTSTNQFGGGGDNFGSHIATQTINANSYAIINSTNVSTSLLTISTSNSGGRTTLSRNGNTLNLVNTIYKPGALGIAPAFNGINGTSYGKTTENFCIVGGTWSFSISFWAYIMSNGGTNFQATIGIGSPGTTRSYFEILPQGGAWYLNGGGDAWSPTAPGNVVTYNVWKHYVYTYSSSTLHAEFYIDNVRCGTGKDWAGSFPFLPGKIFIALQESNSTSALFGNLDEVAIWNYPLTSAQISALYNDGLGVYNQLQTGLIFSAHFDDGTSSLVDSSGYGYSGTLTLTTSSNGVINIPGTYNNNNHIQILDGISGNENGKMNIGSNGQTTTLYGNIFVSTGSTTGLMAGGNINAIGTIYSSGTASAYFGSTITTQGILSNGNVGIGTTAPTQKLDVNGQTNTNKIAVSSESFCKLNCFDRGKETTLTTKDVYYSLVGTTTLAVDSAWFTVSGTTITYAGITKKFTIRGMVNGSVNATNETIGLALYYNGVKMEYEGYTRNSNNTTGYVYQQTVFMEKILSAGDTLNMRLSNESSAGKVYTIFVWSLTCIPIN